MYVCIREDALDENELKRKLKSAQPYAHVFICMCAYVCMYVWISAGVFCIIEDELDEDELKRKLKSAQPYAHVFICMYVCMYVCMYMPLYVYTYACMHENESFKVRVNFICVYVCMYLCI